jgi:hypothetical protein
MMGGTMDGWTLSDGVWEGPNGERLRAIAGAQWEGALDVPDLTPPTDLGGFVPSLGGDFPTGGMFSGGDPTTGGNWDRFFSGSVPGAGGGADASPSIWAQVFGPGRDGAGVSPLSAFAQTLGLGAAGLGIANTIGAMNRQAGQERTQQQGQGFAAAAAQPAIAYGTQQVQAAQAGQLPAPMEAAVKQWTDRAKADMRAKLAHLGLGDSTALGQYEAQIDEMALAMKAQLLQQEGSGGVAALGVGANAGLGLAQSGQQNEQLLSSLIEQANRTLGIMAGRQ